MRRRFAGSVVFVLALTGCSSGSTTDSAQGPPPGAASDAKPAPVKPNASAADEPKGSDQADPVPAASPRTSTASDPVLPEEDSEFESFAMMPPRGYQVVEAPDYNGFILGSPDINPQEHLLETPRELASVRSARVTPPRVPAGLQAVPGTAVSDDGLALNAISSVDLAPMVYIPAGQYEQGTDYASAVEGPQHTSYVSAFYIDATEVTVGQYRRFSEAAKNDGKRVQPPLNEGDDALMPAIGVGYRDAFAYAEWAGKALPTETQWEKAARSHLSLPNVWGRGRPLWASPRRPGQLTPVQSYPSDRSLYGVFDMAGNAREWCRDFWDDAVYEEASEAEGGVARDFAGPRRPRDRTLRSVRGSDASWSVTYREGVKGLAKLPTLGFRCVLEFDPEAVAEVRPRSRRDDDD